MKDGIQVLMAITLKIALQLFDFQTISNLKLNI